MEREKLVEVRDLRKSFTRHAGFLSRRVVSEVRAVDGISFTIMPGHTLGLVGESGCGKTTVGKLLLSLMRPSSGEILFRGEDINAVDRQRLIALRSQMQMVFQDPYSSLNPRKTAAEIIGYPLKVIGDLSRNARTEKVHNLLDLVGLNPHHANRYPHQFSGGQRQRIGIARALAVDPTFIVLDEPVSALDVSVQAQIINLLVDLQSEFQLSYLFVSHDLNVVEHVCDRVAVMYLGALVEIAPRDELFSKPRHPYTRALLSAVLSPEDVKKRLLLKDEVPDPTKIPSGCRFHPRCYKSRGRCKVETPTMERVGAHHKAACFYPEQGEV